MSAPVEHLAAGNYYDRFEQGGWSMEDMSALVENAQLPAGLLEPLRAQASAELLVLGSATARNIDEVAKIGRTLRPGQSHHDHVLIVDYNGEPLERHARKLAERQPLLGVRNDCVSQSGVPPLSYPHFSLRQADMRKLPLPDGIVDVAISDYTFNFLSDIVSVQTAFDETARVLCTGGLMLLAVDGNSNYRTGLAPTEGVPFDASDRREMDGGVSLVRFPLSSYLSMAEASGLALRYVPSTALSSLLCGVLQKV